MGTVKEWIKNGKAILGIEFGSTRIKGILIGEDNSPIAEGSYEWENRLENGIWTYDLADVRKGKAMGFPRHLQNMHADSYTMEREQGYLYPHDYPHSWVQQQYLPDNLVGTHYYQYGDNKVEQAAKQYWAAIKGE